MTDKKKATLQGSPKNITPLHNTSRDAQRARIVSYLLIHGSATTLELRRECNCLHPAGRVQELRELGWHIDTVPDHDHDDQGNPHRIGRYVLKARPKSANDAEVTP